jgi:hypothetical protein
MIKVSVDIKQTLAMLTGAQKQVRFAAAVALTRTAKRVEKELRKDLATLDATKYTKEGTFIAPATKANLETTIGIKDKKPAKGSSPAQILKEHFTGGNRGNKPMEKSLMAMGALPKGMRVTVGPGMKLDRFGNPNRAEVTQLLNSLRSHMQVFKGRGKNTRAIGYFAILPGANSHLSPGIYQRIGRDAIKLMLKFIDAATYRKRFDMDRAARSVVSKHFDAEFASAYQAAVASAR